MLFIEVRSAKGKGKGTESWSTGRTECMKGSGLMITEKEREWRGTPMAISTRETFTGAKLGDVESTTGQMERFMTANGKLVSRKATACGGVFLGTRTLASGRIAKQMVMVFISGKTEIDSRDLGSIA